MGKLPFEIVTVVHWLDSGLVSAYPVADPTLSVYGEEPRALEELRDGLAFHLGGLPAEKLPAFFVDHGELKSVRVELGLQARADAKGGRAMAFDVPCWVVDEGKDHWVRLLIPGPVLNELTFYLRRDEDLRQRAEDVLRRTVHADGRPEQRILELFGRRSVSLRTLVVQVERPEAMEPGRHEERRRSRRDEQDRRLLKSVGEWLEAPPNGYLFSRREEADRLKALLTARRRFSALVVGERGVGKTTLIRSLASKKKPLLMTSGAQLIAGQSMFGQLEQRVHRVAAALERLDAVLYFDDLEDLLGRRGGTMDIAGMLRPWLEQERVRLVAEIDPDRLDTFARSHAGFFGLLHQQRLEPLSADQTVRLLVERGAHGGGRRRSQSGPIAARFEDPATAERFVQRVIRYFPYGRLPGSAVRLADELAAGLIPGEDGVWPRLTSVDLDRGLSEVIGIPEMLLRDDEALKLETLRQTLGRRLVGQHEAVERLARSLCSVKARIQPEGRPLAVLMFVGPTGVGKTQAARALASLLYGGGRDPSQGRGRLIRFDMSEYADPWSADRLIRGSDRDEGLLVREIRRRPFSVLLLDEIEKAHDTVFDLLLQVFGEGRLSSGKGRTVYFHNTLIILTSNLGTTERRSSTPGFAQSGPALSSAAFYQEQVQKRFRPELVNRLDQVVAFEPLTPEELTRVAALQIDELARRRGLEERGVSLEVDEQAVAHLANKAHSPEHGARALRRYLHRHLVEPAAEWLSELGSKAYGATLRVSLVDSREAPESTSGAQVRRCSDLLMELKSGSATDSDGESRSLIVLQDFRRKMRRAFADGSLLELEQRLALIASQSHDLSRSKNRQGTQDGAAIAALGKEQHRLTSARKPLKDLQLAVEEAEELALVAFLEGEPVDGWTSSLGEWRQEWWRRLPAALLATEKPRDVITLLLEEPDGARGLGLWLSGLVVGARSHDGPLGSWQISGRPISRSSVSASALDSHDLVEAVAEETRDFRAVLLEVQGPEAGGWLAVEGGLHRFVNVGPSFDTTAHVRVRRMAFKGLSQRERDLVAELDPGRRVPMKELQPQKAHRLFDLKRGTVALAGGSDAGISPLHYWSRFHEVVARSLWAYEDGGRHELWSCELDSSRKNARKGRRR